MTFDYFSVFFSFFLLVHFIFSLSNGWSYTAVTDFRFSNQLIEFSLEPFVSLFRFLFESSEWDRCQDDFLSKFLRSAVDVGLEHDNWCKEKLERYFVLNSSSKFVVSLYDHKSINETGRRVAAHVIFDCFRFVRNSILAWLSTIFLQPSFFSLISNWNVNMECN